MGETPITSEASAPPDERKRPLRETLLPWITTPLLLAILILIWHYLRYDDQSFGVHFAGPS